MCKREDALDTVIDQIKSLKNACVAYVMAEANLHLVYDHVAEEKVPEDMTGTLEKLGGFDGGRGASASSN